MTNKTENIIHISEEQKSALQQAMSGAEKASSQTNVLAQRVVGRQEKGEHETKGLNFLRTTPL